MSIFSRSQNKSSGFNNSSSVFNNSSQVYNKQSSSFHKPSSVLNKTQQGEYAKEWTKTPKTIQQKRHNFQASIRRAHISSFIQSRRQLLLQQMLSQQFLKQLRNIANNSSQEIKELTNVIQDLLRNVKDVGFCRKLNQETQVIMFIVHVFQTHVKAIEMKLKIMIVETLTLLTYFSNDSLNREMKQRMHRLISEQIHCIKYYAPQQISYLTILLDLLMNIVADNDIQINIQIMDGQVLQAIVDKLNQMYRQASQTQQNSQSRNMYMDSICGIRERFIQIVYNLSESDIQSVGFLCFFMHEVINDLAYLESKMLQRVLSILINFFKMQNLVQQFFDTQQFCYWFQNRIPSIIQSPQPQNCSSLQIKLFNRYLSSILKICETCNNQIQAQQIHKFIDNDLSIQYLNQMLIVNGQEHNRNSKCVMKVIQMLELMAQLGYQNHRLLKVANGRTKQDLFKVLLNSPFFQSYRVSAYTLSFLSKVLGNDFHLLQILMELRVTQSLQAFLDQDINILIPYQVINFLQFLTILIEANDDLQLKRNRSRESSLYSKNINQCVRFIENKGLLKKIEKFQDFEQREVSQKAEMFLKYFQAKMDCNEKTEREIQI